MAPNSRLMMIAGMIREGDRVADIGTDHAYLPVFLVKSGKCPVAFACDVSDGPLKTAEQNVKRSGVEGIVLRKGDGLAAVDGLEIDTAVIAGMGGDLIVKILSACEWVKNERYELILQPMTSVEDLRLYLLENGFCVKEERAVLSQGRIYTVMKVVFDGVKRECTPLFYYFGLLTENVTEAELTYIKRKRRIIKTLAKDLMNVERKTEDYRIISEALEETKEFQ